MRKLLGWVLVGVGAFLLVVGVLATTWAPDQTQKTPLDVNSQTYLTGTAQKINPDTGELEDLDVKILSDTKVDSERSTDDVALFVNTTCVTEDAPDTPDCVGDKNDPRLINNSVDVFATDRVTALAVNDQRFQERGATTHEGLVNKWPFDTQRKTYPYWDGMLNRAVDVTFEGVERIDGLETYKFREVVEEEPAEVATDIDGLYSQDKTIWVEPKTGSIIKQQQSETRTTEDGETLFQIDAVFTDETIAKNVADAKDNVGSLNLLGSTVPLIGFIGGPILLIVGLILALGGRRRGTRVASKREPARV